VPIHAGAAVEIVGQAVAIDGTGIQEEVSAVDNVLSAGAAGQPSDASGVIIRATPLSQDGGQGGGVVVVRGRAGDQNVAAAAGLQRRLPGAAERDVSSASADAPHRATAP